MGRRILAIILAELLVLAQILTLAPEFAFAANESFVQTDWSGGSSADVAVHPTNQTGWTKYSSKDANIATTDGKLTLSPSTGSVVETTDTDFGAGTGSNVEITGTGTAAAIKLTNSTNDALRTTLGKWGAPSQVNFPIGAGASACYPGSGNYIYVLRGNHTRDFMRYDMVNKKWDPMAPTPKLVAAGGDLAYPGTGNYIYALRGNYSKDFWRYNITTNTWESLADTPEGIGYGGSIVAYDTDTLYVLRGWYQTTFWKYTISTNTWLVRAVAPGVIRSGSNLCYPGSGNYIYAMAGESNALYRYDVTLNSWSTMTNANYYTYGGGDLVAGGDGYLYAIFGDYWTHFARYSISGNSWETLAEAPFIEGWGSALVKVSGTPTKIYGLTGGANTLEMPYFDLSSQQWSTFNGPGRYDQSASAFILVGNYIYGVQHGRNRRFYRFNITTEQWEDLGVMPGYYPEYPQSDQLLWTGSGSAYQDYIFWLCNYSTDKGKLYKYSISSGTWTYVSTNPDLASDNYASYAADLFYPGTGDFAYVLKARWTSTFYKVHLGTGEWTALAPAPGAIRDNHGICYAGGYLYVSQGRDAYGFYRYDITANTWTTLTNSPVAMYEPSWSQGADKVLIYPGSGDTIYFNTGLYNYAYKYSISNNSWTANHYPAGDRYSSQYYPGGGDFIYVSAGRTNRFYKYSISAGTYTELARKPFSDTGVVMLMASPTADTIYYRVGSSFPTFIKYTISTNTWSAPCYDYSSRSYGFYRGGDTIRVGDYIYALLGGGSRSFYRYDIANDLWQTLQYTPAGVGDGGYLVYPASGGDFIYATRGGYTKDFWKYSISNNTWTNLADTLDTISTGAAMAAPGDGFIYLLRGGNQYNYYKYSIANNSWSNLNNSPRRSYQGTEMLYPGTGSLFYVMMTYDSQNYFYSYNYTTDTWTTLAAYPRQNRGFPSFTYAGGDYIYCLDSQGTPYLYRYSISGNSWTTLANLPSQAYYEGQLEWGGPNYSDFLFAWTGCRERNSGWPGHKYSISTNKWDSPPFGQGVLKYYDWGPYALVTNVFYNGKHYLYVSTYGDRQKWFYRYCLEDETWEQMTSPPYTINGYYGGDIHYPGTGDYIYAIAGGSQVFMRYSISGNSWQRMASTPEGTYEGARLAYGNDGYLYATRGARTTTFWRYNISSNTWSVINSVPGSVYYGSDLEYVAKNNSIYCLRGYDTNSFYKFNVSTQTWSTMAEIPARVSYGGGLAYPGIGDYIYASTGGGRTFFRYSITNNTWEELDNLPQYHVFGDMSFGGDNYLYLIEGRDYGYHQLYRYNVFASGEFTSQVIEMGNNAGFGAADWTDTADGLTTLAKVLIRTSDSATMSGAPAFSEYATDGADMSGLSTVTDYHKYLQYKVELKTLDLAAIPEFRDITFNYLYYPLSSSLTSSVYDSTALRNRLMKLSWTETLPTGTDIRFQLRSSPDNSTWSNWLGPTGTTSVTDNFSTEADYAKSSKIVLENGAARLAKDLEDFAYKQQVIIDNTGQGAGTNMVATINIASTNTPFWSHVSSSGADIRFYDPTTGQKMPYNLSSFNYSAKTASIDIKIASIGAGEVRTVYMLYGSSSAVSESDIQVSPMPKDGLMGWWKFDEGTGTTTADSSGNRNTGTLTNGPTWTTASKLGPYCLQFDGSNDYVNVPNSTSLQVAGDMTIGFWLYITNAGSARRNPIHKEYAREFSMTIEGDRSMSYYHGDGSSYYNASGANALFPSGTVQNGVWQHMAIVRDNTAKTVKAYYNGSLLKTLSYSGSYNPSAGTAPVMIGDGYESPIGGKIDEVVIYNRALSASEVTQLYNYGGGGAGNFMGSVYIPVPEEQATSPTLGASWPYREVVTLTNAGSAKTDYVIKMELNKDHNGFWTRIQDDLDDIRFIDSDNTTSLNYWIETYDYTAKTATLWVKVPSIPTGTKTIYMYYGNATATSESNSTIVDPPSTGLQGWWKFDEGTGTTAADSSGNNRTATFTGSPTWITGKTGKGINFASGQYASITEIPMGTTWTLGAWVKFPLPTTSDGWRTLFVRVGGVYHHILISSEGILGSWNEGWFSSGYDTSTLSAGWHHIAAVASGGSTTKYFVDGTAVGTSSTVVSQGFSCIGNHTNGRQQIGAVDEAVCYNRALSDAEITQLSGGDTTLHSFSYPETANDYMLPTYYTDHPTIQPIIGAFYNNDLVEFLETATKSGSDNIKYQVSHNGYEWYYWNGSAWTIVSGGYSQANTAAEVNTNLAAFMTQIASSGEFIYRAYLHSNDGSTTPSLDNISINLNTANTFFLDYTGSEGINSIHTDATNDRYFQYKATLYSSGESTPILDDLTLEYITPYLTITSPVGGEVWSIGSAHNITWNKDGLTNVANGTLSENVKIEYSTDGGSTWKVESASAPNTGSYTWIVDDDHTTQARVKISSLGWPVITTESTSNFRIVGSVSLTRPTGGERWLVGTQENITWTSTGTMPEVKIEYSTNSGTSWSPVVESEGTVNDGIVANDGSFTWTIPDEITSTSTCLVRVSDAADADTVSTLAQPFRIIGAFNVTYPTQNVALTSGAEYNVTWTTTGTIPQVNLTYSIDSGATWLDMAGNAGGVTTVSNTGTYSWTVPNPLSETCILRVTDKNDSTVYDDSPNFYIRAFQISSPNGAEEWELGFTHAITWSSGGIIETPIDIYLSTDGGTTYPYWITRRTANTGSYNWTISGTDMYGATYSASDTCKIKVIDAGSRADVSDANFKLMANPAITVTSPTATSQWRPGSIQNITWTTTGRISSDIAIEYTVDGGTTWTAVSPAPTAEQISAKSYPWTLPNFNGITLPANLRVRVRETTLPSRDTQTLVSGTSADGAQIISPIFNITAPTSDTVWVAGDTSRAITWTSEGTLIDNLKLDYSVDNGTTWTNIVTFTQAQYSGSYNWTNIPEAAVGNAVLIRISDSRTPSAVTDNSDAFTILPHQRITLTAPTGGEQLIQGDSYNITWNWDGQATTSTLKLQLSEDGGATWPEYAPYLIADQLPNSPTSYAWVLPSTIDTNQAKIRIYDVNDPLVTSTTENFTITIPQINVTAPAGGSQWYATGAYNITWTTVGSVSSSLKIEYRLSADGGTTWGSWQTITAATSPAEAAAKSKAWVVPDSVGSIGQVRITDNNRTVVTDTSDTFSIIAPTVSITSPTGSETGPNAWVVGTQHDISWTTTGGAEGAISSLRIQYTTDGSTFTTITTITESATLQADSGSYTWTVPDAVSATARIKIFDPARTATTGTSNQFEIKAPSVTITAPNGGESWIIGTDHTITWYSVGAVTTPLKLYYTADGINYVQITDFDGVNDGSYTWTVPDNYSPGLAKIKLTDSYTPTPRSDTSDGSFTIAYPTITPTTPTTLFSATEVATLSWTSEGTLVGPNLKVEWSTDDFATSTIISQTVPKADTSVLWTIPTAAVSANCKFRVTDLGRPQSWGKSGAFTVLPVPSITITSPTIANVGADAWRIGKVYNITWTSNSGKISNDLKLQYSLDNGSTWTNIVAGGEANDGTYSWTVPTDASASTTCKVKIYDNVAWKTGTNLSVTSDTFEIAIPRITITSPAGGEYWAVGDSAPITWTSDGFINDNLSIQYTADGTNYYSASSGEANDGSYTWTVPDVGATSAAKIKIIDASSNYGGVQVIATSNAFNIIATPTITVTAPNGGEEYVLGDTLPIRWTSRGLQVQNVKIEYSADNFTTASTIIESTPNNGSYNWVIPETALSGSTIKVRISMVGNSSVNDTSDANFRIRGGFTVTSPTTNQRLIVGKSETITWTTRGTIANVAVKYSATGAAPWTTITSSTPNTGTYSFAVPEPRVQTAAAKVRIEDATDSTVYAESAPFRADYYTITWRVLDYDTNAPLQQLSTNDNRNFWVDQTGTLSSPVDHDYPYNSYTTFWSKSGYIERSQEWTADDDKTITIALENQLTAMVQWHVGLSTSYTASTDTLKATCWLERRGKLIGTVETDLADLQWAKLEVFDAGTCLWSYTETTNDGLGSYAFTWTNTGLEGGKSYFVKATVSYRDSTYTSGSTIDVTSAKDQQATRALLEAEALKTTAIQTAVTSTLPSQISEAKTEIKSDTASILTATEETIPAKITTAQTAITDIVKSEILNVESTIRSGQTLVVRFRTYSGLSPTIDVYNARNVKKVDGKVMTEIGTTGIYEYSVKFLQAWGKGDFTIVCSESTKGTMDAMTITVLRTDIEQVYGQVSSILGTTTGITGLKSVADTLNSQFSVIETALSKVGKDLVKEVKEAASSATALESIYTQLTKVARQIKELSGETGISLEKLYSVASEKKQDIMYLKNKTQELKAVMELNQKMVDNIANRPITQTWYEYK